MIIVLCIATAVLVVITLLPCWRNPHWLIRVMEFARLQIVALAITLVLLQLLVLRANAPLAIAIMSVTWMCVIWQLWWILPYSPFKSCEVLDAESADPQCCLRILTANVLITNRNAQGLLDLIRQHQPDVIVTLESDQWWQDQLDAVEPQCLTASNVRSKTATACTSIPDCPCMIQRPAISSNRINLPSTHW